MHAYLPEDASFALSTLHGDIGAPTGVPLQLKFYNVPSQAVRRLSTSPYMHRRAVLYLAGHQHTTGTGT